MQVHAGLVRQRFHKIMHQHGLKIADALLLDGDIVGQIDAPAYVNHCGAQRLIQRYRCLAESADTRTLTQRLPESASEHDSDVLNGMVVINMKVALCVDREIEEPVAGEAVEHMIEERDAR